MLLLNQCPKCRGSLRPMDFNDGVECINCGWAKFLEEPIKKIIPHNKKIRTMEK